MKFKLKLTDPFRTVFLSFILDQPRNTFYIIPIIHTQYWNRMLRKQLALCDVLWLVEFHYFLFIWNIAGVAHRNNFRIPWKVPRHLSKMQAPWEQELNAYVCIASAWHIVGIQLVFLEWVKEWGGFFPYVTVKDNTKKRWESSVILLTVNIYIY